jgi:hypothetical protein
MQYCTSLEEALSRCNRYNTENVFFHQDQPIFYRIRVEMDGRKMWQGFRYAPNEPVDNTPVLKQDLQSFDDRLKAIENVLFNGGNNNEKSNGPISISTNNDSSTGTGFTQSI